MTQSLKNIIFGMALGILLMVPVLVMANGKHPHMEKARHHLEQAKQQLSEAAHDYNGHRSEAVRFVDQALEQIRVGIETAK
jgi:uncharacterized membrane-anchored protein YhcB (DUF1043 family)